MTTKRLEGLSAAATALALVLPCMATAQTPDIARPVDPVPAMPVTETLAENEVDFSAGQLEYDYETDIVTATGDVRMAREGNRVRADSVVWNRKTGEVRATGNVAVTNPGGDTAYGDSVELTDTLKDGVVENLLIVLAEGGRLVARRGTRVNGVSTLENAAYTPCPVVDEEGCPKEPSWKIAAVRVVHDPVRKRVSYKGARLELFGLPILALPGLSHPTGDQGGTGILAPDLSFTNTNGVEVALPYYIRIASNRDLTLTPHIYSDALPALEARYRALTEDGAYQIGGFATYGNRIPTSVPGVVGRKDFRGYLDGNGRFQLTPYWSVSGSIRAVTDRTFLRRYDISRDDRLRSNVAVERISPDSYFALNGWVVQTIRAGERQGLQPVALPEIDFRQRIADPLLGGKVELQLNSLALGRTSGQDTQRAFAGLRYDVRRITGLGQEVIFTGYARGDVYHSDETLLTPTLAYRGTGGWNGRFIGALATEMRWPFMGGLFGGTQRLTPRVQIVASPSTPNLRVPNEDARSVDLEDSNLFALNRFPGYDRWEDGTRITAGLDWALDRPGLSIQANIGQSYRLNAKPTLFPDGTGLTNRTSDIVGRTTVKFRRLVSFTHRYRLDKDSLAIRRNEIDATFGTDQTYATVGYLRLDRNIGPQLEDLRDREEIRVGGRIHFARYWSVFGSTIIDLTGAQEDPLTLADGYEPVRHRLGISYDDDCLTLGLTWRRDYDAQGDARRGNSFQLRVAFRNLGR